MVIKEWDNLTEEFEVSSSLKIFKAQVNVVLLYLTLL